MREFTNFHTFFPEDFFSEDFLVLMTKKITLEIVSHWTFSQKIS
jgi:hypothetical protein